MKNEFTTISKGANTVGTLFALIRNNARGDFEVWVRCANYAGHVRGGIAYTWRIDAQKLDETAARALYARRLKGKAK